MDSKEDAFLAKLLATFKIEADEHLKNLNAGMLAIEKSDSTKTPQDLLETVFREAHSLKGAARSVNHGQIQLLCQAMENIFAALRQRRISFCKEIFDAIYSAIDLIDQLLEDSAKPGVKSQLNEMVQRLEDLVADALKTNIAESRKSIAPPEASAPNPQISIQEFSKPTPLELSNKPGSQGIATKEFDELQVEDTKKEPPAGSAQQFKDRTVRVSLSKLDSLFQQAEELLTVKLTSQQQLHDLKLLERLLLHWSKEALPLQSEISHIPMCMDNAAVQQKGTKISQFFDQHHTFIKSFKEILARLIRSTSQDCRLVGSIVDSLLDDTKKLLMQPFSTVIGTFPRMVRDLSNQLEKEVLLDIQGAEIEIDRRILEELKDPLIHLMRNCIDHGIEAPSERKRKNKPGAGVIHIAVSQLSSNSVEIIVADDGQGINLSAVKQSAIKQKIITPQEAELLADIDATMLIFQSGISTSRIVTELSGRGLGMGILLEKVDKLGGQLTVDTNASGTTFRIVLPLTLATFRGIQLQSSGRDFIMPTQSVRRVLRIKANEVKTLENRLTVTVDGKALSFVHLKDILGLPDTEAAEGGQEWITVLIVKAVEQTVAVGVDAVINEREVLVKRFGKQLTRVKNILSATVMEMGKVVPILNPSDLIKSIVAGNSSQRGRGAALQSDKPPVAKRILLAEDSVTTRMLLKNILEAAGYDVSVAVDGLEAFNMLKNKKVDLLLTDIEMPNMNGFLLTEKVRKAEALKDLPIVLCTSLTSQQDRERGVEVGANAYLDKSSFTQSHLLDVIEKLL